jgi:hypothetical protein
MRNFVDFCLENNLVDVADDGSVTWKEEAVKGGKTSKHKEVIDGGRDGRKDLSSDYVDYCHSMKTVWPFKLIAKSGGKSVAPVGK